jgi:hypothetical protein
MYSLLDGTFRLVSFRVSSNTIKVSDKTGYWNVETVSMRFVTWECLQRASRGKFV